MTTLIVRIWIAAALLAGWATAGLAVPIPKRPCDPPEATDTVQSVPPSLSAEAQLECLLQQRRQQPHRTAEIDAEIRDRFLETRAIVVLDMVGFSQMTQSQGIIPALQEIYWLRDIAVPTLEEQGGTVLKVEADNLYATFDSADAALIATDQLLHRLNAADLHASIGIGYGAVLVIGDRDLYGDEMNLASKLGEDLAGVDDILLTAAARESLTISDRDFIPLTQAISGVGLTLYQLQRE